jgi:hypothetical protein
MMRASNTLSAEQRILESRTVDGRVSEHRVQKDEELDAASGGSFQIGNIVSSVAKAVLPAVLD